MSAPVDVLARNRRNRHGVKDQIDCYRTINGARYVAWGSYPSEDRIKAYRDFGVRCRRFSVELYVHEADTVDAAQVDREQEALARVGGAK